MDYIYCAGEEGRVVADIIEQSDHERAVAFIDDDEALWGQSVAGYEVVGGRDKLASASSEDRCIVAYGDKQAIRPSIAAAVRAHGVSLFSAVHPDVTVSSRASLGEGIIVNAQTYIGPDAELYDLVLVDTDVSISHDVVLEEGVTVGPSVTLAGGIRVGEDAYLGAGATVIDDVTIGEGATIGAGAVVIDDVPPGDMVAGVPARAID